MITIEQIKKRIALVIQESELSQVALAKRLGVSQQTISHYVRGDKFPTLERLANLCLVLDVDINYILCLTDLRRSM